MISIAMRNFDLSYSKVTIPRCRALNLTEEDISEEFQQNNTPFFDYLISILCLLHEYVTEDEFFFYRPDQSNTGHTQ